MWKRFWLATAAVFVVWEVMDMVIHGLLLQPYYLATSTLWRPQADIKMGLMVAVVLISAACFCYVYSRFIGGKSVATGALYGLIFGIGAGVAMGYGTYSVMPVPYPMAFGWFLGTLAEAVVGGLIVGAVVTEGPAVSG